MIIPSEWLKTIGRTGFAEGVFGPLRSRGDSVFDDPRYAGSPILIAGRNFGCGSSREHAVWAMLEMGIKAVVARSFSDIFASNAFKNGLVTIVLDDRSVAGLLRISERTTIRIDLSDQVVVTPEGDCFEFDFDPFRRNCLLNGLDEIGITEQHSKAIARYEKSIKRYRPFLLIKE